ncbi:MAG: hypothetical protein ACLGXA_17050 [Acidobacteriota bacterium]
MTTAAAIALSALVAGTLDVTATASLMGARGLPFRRVMQGVASGALGGAAFQGGLSTASIGFVLHYCIACAWATLYGIAALRWPALLARPLLLGVAYGLVVHFIMSGAVLPLSRLRSPFKWTAWLIQIPIHMVCVGIPIAWIQSLALR